MRISLHLQSTGIPRRRDGSRYNSLNGYLWGFHLRWDITASIFTRDSQLSIYSRMLIHRPPLSPPPLPTEGFPEKICSIIRFPPSDALCDPLLLHRNSGLQTNLNSLPWLIFCHNCHFFSQPIFAASCSVCEGTGAKRVVTICEPSLQLLVAFWIE